MLLYACNVVYVAKRGERFFDGRPRSHTKFKVTTGHRHKAITSERSLVLAISRNPGEDACGTGWFIFHEVGGFLLLLPRNNALDKRPRVESVHH